MSPTYLSAISIYYIHYNKDRNPALCSCIFILRWYSSTTVYCILYFCALVSCVVCNSYYVFIFPPLVTFVMLT